MRQIELTSEVRHLINNQTMYVSKAVVITVMALVIIVGVVAVLFLAVYMIVPDPEFLIGVIAMWAIFLFCIILIIAYRLIKKKKQSVIKNSNDILVYEAVVVSDDDPRAAGIDLVDKAYSILFETGDRNNPIGKAKFYTVFQKIKAKPGTMVVLAKLPDKEQLYAFPFAR